MPADAPLLVQPPSRGAFYGRKPWNCWIGEGICITLVNWIKGALLASFSVLFLCSQRNRLHFRRKVVQVLLRGPICERFEVDTYSAHNF